MKYVAKFWRGNRQLKNGGYYTVREIEAKTATGAERKAKKISKECVYGSMVLSDVYERRDDEFVKLGDSNGLYRDLDGKEVCVIGGEYMALVVTKDNVIASVNLSAFDSVEPCESFSYVL